jgi:uncharacterized protein YggU (UPF0235/DUF167 family)
MLVEVKVKSLEVEIRAKLDDNEANERLLSFLAKRLNLPKENLKIVKGNRERNGKKLSHEKTHLF